MAYCPTQTLFLLTVNSICLLLREVVRRKIRWPIYRHKGTVVGAVLCSHANNYIIYLYTYKIIKFSLSRAKFRVRENRFYFFSKIFLWPVSLPRTLFRFNPSAPSFNVCGNSQRRTDCAVPESGTGDGNPAAESEPGNHV
jgi:hypothetical protein